MLQCMIRLWRKRDKKAKGFISKGLIHCVLWRICSNWSLLEMSHISLYYFWQGVHLCVSKVQQLCSWTLDSIYFLQTMAWREHWKHGMESWKLKLENLGHSNRLYLIELILFYFLEKPWQDFLWFVGVFFLFEKILNIVDWSWACLVMYFRQLHPSHANSPLGSE